MNRRRGRLAATVELAPLIDIVFLLLIFFMVSATFIRRSELHIDLPEARGGWPETSDSVTITVRRDGGYAVNGQPTAESELAGVLTSVPQRRPSAPRRHCGRCVGPPPSGRRGHGCGRPIRPDADQHSHPCGSGHAFVRGRPGVRGIAGWIRPGRPVSSGVARERGGGLGHLQAAAWLRAPLLGVVRGSGAGFLGGQRRRGLLRQPLRRLGR